MRVNMPVKHIVVRGNATSVSRQEYPGSYPLRLLSAQSRCRMWHRCYGAMPRILAPLYQKFDNIAVACVIHKLRRSVSRNFWVNISDASINIPGFVEFSNLRPFPYTIVYVPYYMPASHEKSHFGLMRHRATKDF